MGGCNGTVKQAQGFLAAPLMGQTGANCSPWYGWPHRGMLPVGTEARDHRATGIRMLGRAATHGLFDTLQPKRKAPTGFKTGGGFSLPSPQTDLGGVAILEHDCFCLLPDVFTSGVRAAGQGCQQITYCRILDALNDLRREDGG